ncbi:MAG: hypothetical protein ABI910_03570 [Gemmatimonadota bacterium]
MRSPLLRFAVPVIVIAAAWIFGGPSISALLDRCFTVALRTTPLGEMSIDEHDLSFADRRWPLRKDGVMATNARGEVAHEAKVDAYLERDRHWSRDAYRLEAVGESADGASAIVSVVHIADERAPAPGAGRSLSLRVDRASGVVSGEIGAQ